MANLAAAFEGARDYGWRCPQVRTLRSDRRNPGCFRMNIRSSICCTPTANCKMRPTSPASPNCSVTPGYRVHNGEEKFGYDEVYALKTAHDKVYDDQTLRTKHVTTNTIIELDPDGVSARTRSVLHRVPGDARAQLAVRHRRAVPRCVREGGRRVEVPRSLHHR